jgi:hypothetical protein
MLRIDRVTTELDVMPSSPAPGGNSASSPVTVAAIFADPRARQHVKELVREALNDQLRELERSGVV